MLNTCISILKNKFYLIVLQCAMSGIFFGIFIWTVVNILKNIFLPDLNLHLNTWTYIFYNPFESSLFNCLALYIGMSLYALAVYLIGPKDFVEVIAERIHLYSIVLLLLLTFSVLFELIVLPSIIYILISLLISLLPFFVFLNIISLLEKRITIIIPILILMILSIEPLRLMVGPIYLTNDYPDIYGETNIADDTENKLYVSNKKFLSELDEIDLYSIKGFYDLINRFEGKNTLAYQFDHIDFLEQNVKTNLKNAQQFIETVIQGQDITETWMLKGEFVSNDIYLRNLHNIDIETIKRFYLRNKWEYIHQDTSRGQVNHIGHILNPINEMINGKSIKKIYLQYGLGTTLVFKWTMDYFGGLSIENYYKCYIYYILYSLLFLLTLMYVFKDKEYVCGAFAVVAIGFYWMRYFDFVFAPGLSPVKHLFDSVVVIFLMLYIKYSKNKYLYVLGLLALVSILLNQQFGVLILFSIFVSLLLYEIDKFDGKTKYIRLITLLSAFLIICLFSLLIPSGKSGLLQYFFFGFFSQPIQRNVILLTISYMVVSYSFLLWLKNERTYHKYVYVYLGVYIQCLLIYYFWSGLSNHLTMVIPFIGFQMFFMALILQEKFKDSTDSLKFLFVTKKIGIWLSILLLLGFIIGFYKSKKTFADIFKYQKTYQWNFERANLISTINPEQITASVFLIQQYSSEQNGIYILSKYDGILPFLSKKYSAMPYFELAGYLLSPRQSNEALDSLIKDKPYYMFVDSNIDNSDKADLWAKIYNNNYIKLERASRLGRDIELQKIFNRIADSYELVEKGTLISVYRRKSL